MILSSLLPLLLSLVSGSLPENGNPIERGDCKVDHICHYARDALNVIVGARLAPYVLEPFRISEYFKSLSNYQLPITNKGMGILVQLVAKMEEYLEAETLGMTKRIFLPLFEYTNNHMAVCINHSLASHYYIFFPPELQRINRSKTWSMAISNWVNFNEILAHASPKLRDNYVKQFTSQEPADILEERLRRLEDNVELVWAVDHLYSWGNVISSYYYSEYLRHALLASGNVFDCPIKKRQWLRLKMLFETFQRCNLIVPQDSLIVDEPLVPPRYYGTTQEIFKEPLAGCTAVFTLKIYKLPSGGIPFLHLVTCMNTVIIYYSHHLKERKDVKEYLRQSGLDEELAHHVHKVIMSY